MTQEDKLHLLNVIDLKIKVANKELNECEPPPEPMDYHILYLNGYRKALEEIKQHIEQL